MNGKTSFKLGQHLRAALEVYNDTFPTPAGHKTFTATNLEILLDSLNGARLLVVQEIEAVRKAG